MIKPGEEKPVFKSQAELQAECRTVGITPDSTVYIYCFEGARASNTFIALIEAGVKDVRLYFGLYRKLSKKVISDDVKGAAAGMMKMRPVMATNLILGMLLTAIGISGSAM